MLFLALACSPENEIHANNTQQLVSEEPEYISSTCLGGTRSSARQVDPEAFAVELSAKTEPDGTVRDCGGVYASGDSGQAIESEWSAQDGGSASVLQDAEWAGCTDVTWSQRAAHAPAGWTVTMEEAIAITGTTDTSLFVATLLSAGSAEAGRCYFSQTLVDFEPVDPAEPVWVIEAWPPTGAMFQQDVVHATTGEILGRLEL